MNLPLSIEVLKRLKSVMQAMAVEANNADWQELSRLDNERRKLIDYKDHEADKRSAMVEAPGKGQLPQDISAESHLSARGGFQETYPPRSFRVTGSNDNATTRDPEYLALCKELTALDTEISNTVQKARQALLEQTRGLRAQVSAKKRYEQANTMKVSSYS